MEGEEGGGGEGEGEGLRMDDTQYMREREKSQMCLIGVMIM